MRLLIDLDNIVFRCLKATETQRYYSQLRACDFTLDCILDRFNRPSYDLVLSGSDNFRKVIYPEYKANRDTSQRPRYLTDARNYFIKYRDAQVAHGMEADDMIASLQNESSIMVVNDHDYFQVGGKIYNPWTHKLTEIDNPEFYFWRQVLTGCKGDNVPGLPNPEKAHWKKQPNFNEDSATPILEGLSVQQNLH